MCDDEYWDDPDPEKAFKQPPGKPSNMDFIISLLKLVQIMAFALRTIVSAMCLCWFPENRSVQLSTVRLCLLP